MLNCNFAKCLTTFLEITFLNRKPKQTYSQEMDKDRPQTAFITQATVEEKGGFRKKF
jgi:hypothetical protein